MVKDATQIGFHLFGYEQSGTGSPKLRELGQMRNIMAYRAKHPDGKLLLHVGYFTGWYQFNSKVTVKE